MIDLHHISRRTGRTVEQTEIDFALVRRLQDPIEFARTLFAKGDGWLYPGPLPKYAAEGVRLVYANPDQSVAWIWPRGHLKTTLKRIVKLHQTAYRLKKYQAVFAATDDRKKGWNDAIRSAFLDPVQFPEFHWLLPYYFDGKDPILSGNQDELTLSNGVRFDFRSAKGESRGLNAAQGRPDAVELDDITPSEAATSDTVREKGIDFIFSVIRFIGSAQCQITASATILHKQDYFCKVADGVIGGWVFQRLRASDPDFSNVLWPERWTGEQLRAIYEKEYVAAGKAHLFARELWNDPATEASHPFANVNPPKYRNVNYDRLYRVISIDHAAGTGGDDFAIMETGEDEQSQVYVLDAFFSNQINLPQKLSRVEAFLRRRRPMKLVIGRTSESMTFIEVLTDHLRSKGIFIFVDTPSETADKNERIRAWLEPRYLSGTIHHPEMVTEWGGKLERSLRAFDVTTKQNYDDPIDVLARCVEYSKPAHKHIEREQRPLDPRAAKLWDLQHGIVGDPDKADEYPNWK